MAKTTKDDLELLWVDDTDATFSDEDKKNVHEYTAGSITVFDCDNNCTLVSLVQNGEVLLTKRGPGHMSDVPNDISIFARNGSTKGS